MSFHVFIGYDPREPKTYDVCEHSIHARSSGVVTHKLDHHALRREGLFSRPWRISAEGQYTDEIDGRPFSTTFAFTRFLVPTIARKINAGRHVLFVDSDFVFLRDVNEIVEGLEEGKAVHVVKHDYRPIEIVKMDNKIQTKYQKKLWSALCLYDLDNPLTLDLTPDMVNHADGSYLHQFRWLPGDECIGALDPAWQYIPEFSKDPNPFAVHYTLGTPEIPGYERCPMSEIWYKELHDLHVYGTRA